MPTVADQLYNYAAALSDPTRANILAELDRTQEATATQIGRRLGFNSNNAYHHMRILLRLGLVEPPRAVPGPTYVEKFYRLTPETRAALRLDFGWYERNGIELTTEDQKAMVTGTIATMAHLLAQQARRLGAVDAEELDRAVREEGLLVLSRYHVSRRQLQSRVAALRAMMEAEEREFAEDTDACTDLVLLAALPLLAGMDEPE